MKRSYLGLGLLALLLALGFLTSRQMQSLQQPLPRSLTRAAERALASDWDGAGALLAEVQLSWEKHDTLRSALTDHTILEEVDAHLAQLALCCSQRDREGFALLCTETACQLTAIADAQKLTLKNLF